MTYPTLSLDSDIGDLTDYGEEPAFNIQRGSTSLTTAGAIADPATLATVLDNISRDLDPNYVSSPFSGSLVPGVGCTAVATWDSVDYTLFSGRVDDWPQGFPFNGIDQSIDFKATDAFGMIANASCTLTRPAEHTGVRIAAVLTAIGYPGATSVDTGLSTVPAVTLETISALSHIIDCAQVEYGDLRVVPDGTPLGTFTFRDRATIFDPTNLTPVASYVQSGGFNYSDVTLESLPIYNEVVVGYGSNGEQVTVRDETSIAAAWSNGTPRSLSLSLPFATSSQARGFGRWILLLYANPITMFKTVTFTPGNEPADAVDLWTEVLSRQEGDVVTLTLDPVVDAAGTLSGDPIVADCWIRGIQYGFDQYPWSVTFTLQYANLFGLFYWDTSNLDGGDFYGL